MTNHNEQQRRSERPIYMFLSDEVGDALHILVGILELERKNISPETYVIAKEQVGRITKAVEATAEMMQPEDALWLLSDEMPPWETEH
ncbi:hypothetical protein N9903_01915 [bacterium]|nr:hypothetical protein [bacterium]